MAYNIKKLLQQREQDFIKITEEILLGFFEPLKNSIERVVYAGEKTQMVIKSLTPIAQNLNYVSIVISAANYNVGDLLPVKSEDSEKLIETVEVTEENFWSFVDTLTLNIPITVLESKCEETMVEFLEDSYDKPIPEGGTEFSELDENEFMESDDDDHHGFEKTAHNLDDVQKKTLELYKNKGSIH